MILSPDAEIIEIGDEEDETDGSQGFKQPFTTFQPYTGTCAIFYLDYTLISKCRLQKLGRWAQNSMTKCPMPTGTRISNGLLTYTL